MKIVLQRVSRASVRVEGANVGAIDGGLMVLFCAQPGDDDAMVETLAGKISRMRIFNDADGKMNQSVLDIGGAVLAISQFTLAADWRKGNRPSFSGAAPADIAQRLYDHFCGALRAEGIVVETGVFGAHMAVDFVNDGPVTIIMDSADL